MPHEENRKIIKVGETSYAVILPKPWVRYYKLTDKDEVKVVSNSTVTIEPPRKNGNLKRIGRNSQKCALDQERHNEV